MEPHPRGTGVPAPLPTGWSFWSLTDHDEIGGQHRAIAAAHAAGMAYLTGAEISVTFAGVTVHIVGLGFDPDNAALREGLAETRDGRIPLSP